MATKQLKEGPFKHGKLAKTGTRRKRQARARDIAEVKANRSRNDVLPMLAIVNVALADLQPPRHRTRKDSPAHRDEIIRSIEHHGFAVPILVREGRVLDGWSRVVAARELGLDRVPAIGCDHLTEPEARALALAVNRTAEKGEWDLSELKLEFEELIALDVDLDAAGFTLQEQDIVLTDELEDQAGEEEEEEKEEPPERPVARTGDIWQLDDHRIICGNALEPETYGALLGDEIVHGVLQDPPYNVKIKGNVSGLGKTVHEEFAMASGEMSREAFQEFLDRIYVVQAPHVATGGVFFTFMDWRSIARVYAAAEAAGLSLFNLAVWYKQSGAMGTLYRSAHELVAVHCKGGALRCNNVALGKHGRDRTNVWVAPGANRRGSSANEMLALHATPKPVELCVDAILDVTNRGEIVLDGFLGSGTTLIAAEKSGRICRGIELEPKFVDVAVKRWERLTGGEAILAATGEPFAEIAEQRLAEEADGDSEQVEGEGA